MFSYNIFISLPGPYIRLLFQCMLSLESVFLFFFIFYFLMKTLYFADWREVLLDTMMGMVD